MDYGSALYVYEQGIYNEANVIWSQWSVDYCACEYYYTT